MSIKSLTKKQGLILVIICAALCASVLFACFYAAPESGIIVSPGALADALEAEGYDITKVSYNQISSYSDSASAMLMNAAAAYPFEKSRGGKFTPLYLSTIVIAVDKTQTNAAPSSWAQLLGCKDKVELSSLCIDLCNMSLVYALGGENEAVQYLSELQKQGRLVFQKGEAELFKAAPIAVITDDTAARLIKQGMKLAVFVPTEGALAMPWGLYEKTPEIELSRTALINAGLRLADGSCDAALYPGDYSPAHIIDDYQGYGQGADGFYARFRREVLGIRLYTTANGFEHLLSYLLFSAAICVWAFSLYIRAADRRFQRILLLQAALLLFWILIRYLKLIIYGNIFLLWYCYYLPKLFSPLLFVYACRIETENKRGGGARRLNIVLAAVTSLLLLFVLTNNAHQLVFGFPSESVMDWTDDYTYNFGYFIVLGWIAFLLVYGFLLLFRRAKQALSTRMILAPVIALALLLFYGISYVCRVQIARESEFSFVISAFILILWELCLDTGLFQSNTRYAEMFSHTKLPIWLLSGELKIWRRSEIAGELPINAAKAVMEGKTRVNTSRSDVCDIMKIHGGYAVWQTDMSHVLSLQEQLREKAKETAEQNIILQKEAELKKETAMLRHRQNAVVKLESVISDKLKEIRALTESLSDKPNESSKRKLIRIKLLTGFCKRIGMLVLSDECEGFVKTETLGLLLSEAAIDVDVAAINCSVYYADAGKLPAKNAADLYTLFSRCMMSLAHRQEETTVFCRLLPVKAALSLILIIDITDDAAASRLCAVSNDFSELEIICSREDEGFIIKAAAGGYVDD